MSEQFAIGAVEDFVTGKAVRVDVGSHRIAVVRIGDDFYAIGDRCSHADVALSEGEVYPDEKELECWKHGSTFSLETGKPTTFPATRAVPVYEVFVEDGKVWVKF